MLKALVRKDLALCRFPLIAGVLLLLSPFAVAIAMVANTPIWTEATPATVWAMILGSGSYFSIMCSQPTLAMISGNLIAAERSDRSAEFLAYLPPSKRQVLGSKFAVLLLIHGVIWGSNLIVAALAHWFAGDTQAASLLTGELVSLRMLASIGFVAVGAGWLVSSMAQASGPAVGVAFMAPLLILISLNSIHYLYDWPSSLEFTGVFSFCCVVGGVLGLAAGSAYYLRRVEP